MPINFQSYMRDVYIDELEEQNKSLQSELDKAIHQLKDYEKALKEYAARSNWSVGSFMTADKGIVKADEEFALETLKKWED